MQTTELSNKFKIFDLVNKAFGYDKESLALFKHRLFYERIFAKEFKNIYSQKDLRLRIPIDVKELENFDSGWSYFKSDFSHFVEYYNIKYKDFKNNYIVIGKQRVKLKKAIISFYMDRLSNFLPNSIAELRITPNLLRVATSRTLVDIEGDCYVDFFMYDGEIITYQFEKFGVLNTGEISIKDKTFLKCINAHISEYIRISFENIGTDTFPTGELELVASLNFADWFLCSAAENWSSCLNINAMGSESYWSGIPSLIGDKNIIMFYLTKKNQKKKIFGIETDKFIVRTFARLARNKNSNKTCLLFHNVYPLRIPMSFIVLKSKMFETLPIHSGYGIELRDYVSRYYIENFFQGREDNEIRLLSSIFNDIGNLHLATKNKTKYFPCKYSFVKYESDNANYGFPSVVLKKNKNEISTYKFVEFNGFKKFDSNLERMIDDKISLLDFNRNFFG